MANGLLDFFGKDYEDPRTQGLLQFGLGLMQQGGYQDRPVSLGQAMGAAGQQGMQAYQQAVAQKRQAEEQKFRQSQMNYNIQKQKAQSEAEKRAAENMRIYREAAATGFAGYSPLQRQQITFAAFPDVEKQVLAEEYKPIDYGLQMVGQTLYETQDGQLGRSLVTVPKDINTKVTYIDLEGGGKQQSVINADTGEVISGVGSVVYDTPEAPKTFQKSLPNDMIQDQMFNDQTGKYEDVGAPYSRFSPKSPAVQIMPEDKAAEARSKRSIDYAYDQLGKFDDIARQSQTLATEYQMIAQMMEQGVESGALEPLYMKVEGLASALGFLDDNDVRALAAKQTVKAKMDYIIPRMRVEGSGSTSNFEAEMFRDAAPSMDKTTEANIVLARSAAQMAQHTVRVQDERRLFVMENDRLPTSDELGKIVEEKYGSTFKTPLGRKADSASDEDFDAEFDRMVEAGQINIGDVVYMGKRAGDAGTGGFVIMTAELLGY